MGKKKGEGETQLGFKIGNVSKTPVFDHLL